MDSQKFQSADQANKIAMQHVGMLTEAGRELRQIPKVSRFIDGMKRGIPFRWSPLDHQQFDFDTLVRVGDLIGEVAVCELWKEQGRIAYDLHPEINAALYRSRTSAVPGGIFDRLTHINPMVILPDPWPVSDPETKVKGWVRGFFITGWVGTALCTTTDEQREGLALMFFYDQEDEDGELVPGPNRMLIPLPTMREKVSIEETIRFVEKWHDVPERAMDLKRSMKILKPLLRPAFAVLMYLCCDNRDVEEPPLVHTQQRRKTGKGRKEPDPFWVRVGWYIGPALHEARKRAMGRPGRGPSFPSGVEYGPQHRAGHFKTVYHGPQWSKSSSKWVQPYWTHRELLEEGQDPVTQVVPVNPQRKDPLRRRGEF